MFDLIAGVVFIGIGAYSLLCTEHYLEGLLSYQERVLGYSRDKVERGATVSRYMILFAGMVFTIGGIYFLVKFIRTW